MERTDGDTVQEGNGFDVLILKLRASKECLKELSAYFYERAGVEEAYAKALVKVAKQKRLGEESGSLRVAYDAMMSELNASADERVRFAGQLRETGDKLMQYKDMQKSVRKNNNSSKDKYDKDLAKSLDTLEKYKANYLKYSEETHNWRTQERNVALPAKQIQTARKKGDKAEKEKNKYEKLYRDQVISHHDEQQRWQFSMDKLYTDISCVQVQTYDFIRETLLSYADIERARPPVLAQRLEELTSTIESIDSNADIDQWRVEHATGSARPELVSLTVWSPQGVKEIPQTGGGTLIFDESAVPASAAPAAEPDAGASSRAPPPAVPAEGEAAADGEGVEGGDDSTGPESDVSSSDEDEDEAAPSDAHLPPALRAGTRAGTLGARPPPAKPKPAPRPPRSASLADRAPPPPIPGSAGPAPSIPQKPSPLSLSLPSTAAALNEESGGATSATDATDATADEGNAGDEGDAAAGDDGSKKDKAKKKKKKKKKDVGPLPPGWTEHYNEEYNRSYYCFDETGETSWERPVAPAADDGGDGDGEGEGEGGEEGEGEGVGVEAAAPPPLPAKVVEVEGPADAPATVTALYDYDAQYEGELTFEEGDVITVIRRDDEGGWWEGTCRGVTGVFPINFTDEGEHLNADE